MVCTTNMKMKFTAYIAVLIITAAAGTQNLFAATSVTQFGITWTFDKDYTVGQFANGDYWVIGPVTITSINPPSTNSGGRTKNGSQVNPIPTNSKQGYDSSASEVTYDATLNKALNLPLTLTAGSSLVSSISVDTASASPTQIKGASILTVLSSAPAAGSFRPPYCGTDKTIKFNKNQLDYTKLAKLTPTASYPRLKQQAGDSQYSSAERMFERPWIDHIPVWPGRSMHPSDNMPDYGRDMSDEVGTASLMLNLSFTDAEKETLFIRFVQLGIDNYGIVASGGKNSWVPDGGHASGRKWPILFAGIVLNDADMKAIGTDTRFSNNYSQYANFGEDGSTFYVDRAYNNYTSADIGLPEWGKYHNSDASIDDRTWDLASYRCCCTATSWTGEILSAYIMGAKDLWNHDALFDYQDRYMAVEKSINDGYRCWSTFSCEMWDRYRASYGCVWTRTNPNDIYSKGSNGCDSNSPPANQAPTANAGSDQTVIDTDNNGSQLVTLNGSGSSDSDGTIASYVWKEGSTQIATGATPSVTLAVGAHTITLTVTDNGGLTSTDTVIITVNSPNQTPIANAGPDQTVTDTDNNGSQAVTLNGSGSSDSDGSIVSYVWTESGTQIATGATPTVTRTVGTHTITLTVTDNGGLTSSDTVTITVNAPGNTAPTANAGPDQTVIDTDNNGSHSVTLNGSASSDPGGSIASYVWRESGAQIATGATPTVTRTVGTHTITLTVTDNGGLTSTDTVIITVTAPSNQAPTANAGTDQTIIDTDNNGSHSVTLNGSASNDPGGSIVSYVWTESGAQIATGVSPTVTFAVGAHTVTLTVTDNGGLTATDKVVITINAPSNQAPIANAGPDQTVTDTDNNGSHSVALNGSGSGDSDGTIASYVWREGGAQIATGATPTVTRTVGTHTITLTVTDNGGLTGTDTVVITVQVPPNQAPTADAGRDQTVIDTDNNGSQAVTLNGSGSIDSDGTIASYVWKESGAQIATGATPTVTRTVGAHTIALTVTDNGGLTSTDTVIIIVSAPTNQAPIADAGRDQTVTDTDRNGSQAVTLNGSGSSDPNGSITSYVWKEGSTQIATGATPTVTLAVGTHTIALTVTDNGGLTGTDTVVITVTAPNQTPIADAGRDQTVTDTDNNGSHSVTLNGSGSSDPDGSIASYVWKESGAQIAAGVSPTVTLSVGVHIIRLTVTDESGLTASDTVFITVKAPPNQSPTANAGPDQTVADSDNNGNQRVTLDGSGSYDPDGSLTSYVWKETGSQIATGVNPSVTLAVGTHTILLQVTDNGGLTSSDVVIITVAPPKDTTPPSILSVTAAGNTVKVAFSEALNQPSATNISHYSINKGLSVNQATLNTATKTVTLSTGIQTIGTLYTITVTNVMDTAGNAMAPTTYDFSYSEGLTGYWKFNDGSGLSATDSSGNGNTATLVNGVSWTAQGELYFDGANDAVRAGTTNMSASHGSIAMWVYPRSFPNGRNYIFGHSTQSTDSKIQLDCNQSGALELGLGDNAYINTNIQTLYVQQWYHIILTWDGTDYAVYVNGIQKASGSFSGLTSLASYADIGNNGNSSARNEAFNGLIDEARIYSRAISSYEISRIATFMLPIDDKTVAEGKQLNFMIRTTSGIIADLSDNDLPGTPSLSSNVFRWMPGYNDAGTYQVEFTVPHGSSVDFENINVTVTNAAQDTNTAAMTGWWKFDDIVGETAFDSSGNNNTGYLRNYITWDTGEINGAVNFSVPNDAVEIATSKFNPAAGTIAMWIYVERLTLAKHYLFGHADAVQANRLQLYLKYGNLCVGLGNTSETAMNIQRLENQQWYHIALTWSGTSYTGYINGILVTTGAFSGLSGFGPTADIGNSGINHDKALDGRIDEVRIYNYALSAGEIASIAN